MSLIAHDLPHRKARGQPGASDVNSALNPHEISSYQTRGHGSQQVNGVCSELTNHKMANFGYFYSGLFTNE